MKVMQIHDYGGPEQLKYEDAPKPAPGENQLLVQVVASSVNPADWKIRSGATKAMMNFPMPLILGGDIAGVVAALGTGVSGWEVGEEVYAMVGLVGAYAEYVALDASSAARKPANISFEAAASLPLVSLTAWQCLAQVGEVPGKRVLIHNAAGGVGSVAVQIAKAHGAHVLATASASNADFVLSLGAEQVFDARKTDVSSLPKDIDILLDLVGDQAALALLPLVKAGGYVVRLGGGPIDPKVAADANIHAVQMRVKPNGAQLAEIAALVERGAIKPHVTKVLPLAEAGRGHTLSQAGHTSGKIVLKMGV